jgi:Tfp pilus assembly protein PilZ
MKKKEPERSGVERRAHGRVSTQVTVRFEEPGGSLEEGATRDISKGGAFIETDRPRKVGEKFEIFLCLPDGSQEITVLGEVVRRVGFPGSYTTEADSQGLGVRFVVSEPKQRAELETFVESLLRYGGTKARKHPRIKAQVRVNLTSAGVLKQAVMDNISKGGMYLTVDQDFTIGDGLELVLVHPRTLKSVAIVGEVIHQKDTYHHQSKRKTRGLGIRFVGLTVEKKAAIDNFIKSLLD